MKIPEKSVILKKRVVDIDTLAILQQKSVCRSVQDIQTDSPTFGLSKKSVVSLFLAYYRKFEYDTKNNRLPECRIDNKELMSERWANISRCTFISAKKKLVELELIKTRAEDTWRQGKIAIVNPTEKGWALYHKIKAEFSKKKQKDEEETPKKQPILNYTDKDMENARFWFKCLRRYWQGSPGKLKQIGAWERQKEIRANAARKAREKLQITAEEFGNILERISTCSDADFYFKTVLGPDKFNHKWANGTPAEQMREKVEELDKMQEKRNELTITEDDIPENCTQAEEEFWNIMWDVIGERLIRNFAKKGQEKFDEYYDCLANICTELSELEVYERNIAKMKFRSKDVKKKFEADMDKHKSAYFYFLLDKYSYTDCLFTVSMIQDSWWEFWNRVEPDMSSQLREELTPRTFTVNEKE